MIRYPDLEMIIARAQQGRYPLEMRLNMPNSEAETQLIGPGKVSIEIDLPVIRGATHDDTYGRLLTEMVFADEATRVAFNTATSAAQAFGKPMRFRIYLEAAELHELQWERMLDPRNMQRQLAMSEEINLSRYITSDDFRPVQLRPSYELRALIAIADPSGVAGNEVNGRTFPPIDRAAELQRAQLAFGALLVNLDADQVAAPVTLNAITSRAREGYDVLYLVCHGAILEGVAHIWLQKDDGTADVRPGDDLITELRELPNRPRLVVLSSCMSAGDANEPATDDDGVLAALGPRMAERGIPAIIAMQGNISQQTANTFTSKFLTELQMDRKEGAIDRAVSFARRSIAGRADWWAPVLYMRLRHGSVSWYKPGIDSDWNKWPSLLNDIGKGQCTPILGRGVAEPLLGSQREIARRLAGDDFPMAPHDRENLARVMQFLKIDQAPQFMVDRWFDELKNFVRRAHGLTAADVAGAYREIIRPLAVERRKRDEADPHRVLAGLPLPLYIDTTGTDLLADALREADKDPVTEVCRWNDALRASTPSMFETEPEYEPTAQRPIVFQLLGSLQDTDSLVLTEDDFLSFLIGVVTTRGWKQDQKPAIPVRVRSKLADSSLLFLGHNIDELLFRVVFQALTAQEGSRHSKHSHIAAQVDPQEGRATSPDGARTFLERLFVGAAVTVYWGTPEDLTRDLQRRWQGAMVPAHAGDV